MVARSLGIVANRVRGAALPLLVLAAANALQQAVTAEWTVSSNSIVARQAVLITGSVALDEAKDTQDAVQVVINGKPLTNMGGMLWRRSASGDGTRLEVFLHLFYDFQSGHFVFENEGQYDVTVSPGDARPVFRTTIKVASPPEEHLEAFKRLSDQDMLLVILDGQPRPGGISKLWDFLEDCPRSPWTNMVRVSLGKALLFQYRKAGVSSQEDAEKKRRDMARLLDDFKSGTEDNAIGLFRWEAVLWAGYCLALGGQTEESRPYLTRVAATDIPEISGIAKKMLSELDQDVPAESMVVTAGAEEQPRTTDGEPGERLVQKRWLPPLVFAPEGFRAYSGHENGEVRVWLRPTPYSRARFAVHPGRIDSIAYPDSRELLAVGGKDGTVSVWDMPSNSHRFKRLEGINGPVRALAVSGNAKYLAAGGEDGRILVWEMQHGKRECVLPAHQGRVNCLAFSSDRSLLASGGGDGSARCWDMATFAAGGAFTAHLGPVNAVAFSPGDELLITGSGKKDGPGEVLFWDVKEGKLRGTLKGHSLPVLSLALSASGKLLASADSEGTVRVWRLADGASLGAFAGLGQAAQQLIFNADGTGLIGLDWVSQTRVRYWQSTLGQQRLTYHGHWGDVSCTAFSPDGKRMASGGCATLPDRPVDIRVWDTATGRDLATLKGHKYVVRTLRFSLDGRSLWSFGGDGTVRIWDLTAFKPIATLTQHRTFIRMGEFTPDGSRFATAGEDRSVRIWLTEKREIQTSLEGLEGVVWALAFSPDGARMAAGGSEGEVTVWDMSTLKVRTAVSAHKGATDRVAFSPDGRSLVSCGADGTVKVWDIGAKTPRLTILAHERGAYSVSFSPKGNLIASAGNEPEVKLWDPISGKCLTILKGHVVCVYSVDFSSDGRTLATCGADGTVKLWDLAELLRTAAP